VRTRQETHPPARTVWRIPVERSARRDMPNAPQRPEVASRIASTMWPQVLPPHTDSKLSGSRARLVMLRDRYRAKNTPSTHRMGSASRIIAIAVCITALRGRPYEISKC
jgi:hypothetical protein